MYFNCKEAYCINGGQYEKAAESGSTTDNNAQIVEAADTGATLVFDQYDAEAPKGELSYGEDYVIEVLKDGKWEEAPITVEGDYAFNGIGYNLPCEEITEREIDWEWLYGELAPGEYRIGKSVIDSIESGNFDEYMVYAHFILNSN